MIGRPSSTPASGAEPSGVMQLRRRPSALRVMNGTHRTGNAITA